MSSIEQLIESIDKRITELNGEIASLEAARAALVANGAASAARQQPRAKQVARRKPRKRTEVLLAGTAEGMLAESGGLTTAELAEQAGADRDQVLTLLRDLEVARRVRRTGERRSTRWHAITDEDRIRERAAELATRGKRRLK